MSHIALFIFVAGNIIDETELLAHLQYILGDRTPSPEFPISVLATSDRDTWTRARIQLQNACELGERDWLNIFSFFCSLL